MTLKAKVGEQIKLNVLLRGAYAGLVSPDIFSITLPNLGNIFYPVKTASIYLFWKNFQSN